ncbi:hypothetical protein [Dysosmobacter sp.]|uniref:hypothetical protein n=1 Tax=Dysosmobacter sp. TaxID=2591382 RepID=UPI002A8E2E1E|nr:hypothetical protein [Dysosmobacter sp.]MDY3985133.1 hypothetical protein [Dysosmobacter sp.]
MDYAEQELRRQQKALAALLLGRTAEETGQAETAGGETRRAAVLPEETPETVAFKTNEAGGTAVPPAEGAGGRRSYDQARRKTAVTVLGETARRQGTGDAAEGGPAERTVTEFFWADTGGMSDAEDLSRTFQRDARRYDGGFILY